MSRYGAVMPYEAVAARPRAAHGPALIAAVGVAAVLLAAAAGKLMSPRVEAMDWAVVVGESLIALLVLVFHGRRWAWVMVALMFGAFAAYAGQKLATGHACKCFGESNVFARVFTPTRTLAIDVLGVALGLGMAGVGALWGRALPMWALVSGVATTAMGGFGAAVTRSPSTDVPASVGEVAPPSGSAGAVAKLMMLPIMDDVRRSQAAPGGPAWLVYIYNRDCHICQEHLPMFQAYLEGRPQDAAMRVRLAEMNDLADHHGIEMFDWDTPPTTVLFQDWSQAQKWDKDHTPKPEDVRATLAPVSESPADPKSKGRTPGRDAVREFMASALMRDIVAMKGPTSPRWLVYVYNPECPKCLDHLAVFGAFQKDAPPDSDLRVRIFSMPDLEKSLGIAIHEWPGVPITLLIADGQIVKQYGERETPSPYEVWAGR